MKDTKQRIVSSLTSQQSGCDNYLIWAPPGSGKSFFIQEIANSLGPSIYYRELNLAQLDEREFRSALSEIEKLDKPRLCFIDEVDSKLSESWPYEALLPELEPPANRRITRTCFILAGSSGNSLSGMKDNIGKRPKGIDLLSRVPPGNEFVIEGLGLGDRLLVASTQFLSAAKDYGRNIDEAEKLVFYYIALNPVLKSARQIRQLAVRCIERMPPAEERIKYDYLFDAGDPENKEFWNKSGSFRNELVNSYVRIEDDQPQLRQTAPTLEIPKPNELRVASKEVATRKNRIAVLPFTNISPDPKDEYFADGITEELISTLSRIRGMKVISRTSIMRYKQTEKSLSEIAGELNVGAVLEGSVRKMGDDLRITAQLIDVDSDEHLWSEDYDRKFENVFALQKEIAHRVADSLQITVQAKEGKEMGKRPTKSIEAYTLLLKGRALRHRATLESLMKTVDYCEKAIQIDPDYAQAYVEIARSYAYLGVLELLLPSKEVFSKAEWYAQKAIKLDPSLAESHLAVGIILAFYKWDFRGAEMEYRQALEIDPNLVDGHLDLSHLLAWNRRFNEAISEAKRALELDPVSAWTCTYVGTRLAMAHHTDEAIEVLRNAIELDPNSAHAHGNLGWSLAEKGLVEEGIAELKLAIELQDNVVAMGDLACVYSRAGRIDETRNILSKLLELQDQDSSSKTTLAKAYVAVGDNDKAIEYLDRAYEEHSGYLVAIHEDSDFDPLRSDPRFQALVKKIGFY